jgi:hypothetical protein
MVGPFGTGAGMHWDVCRLGSGNTILCLLVYMKKKRGYIFYIYVAFIKFLKHKNNINAKLVEHVMWYQWGIILSCKVYSIYNITYWYGILRFTCGTGSVHVQHWAQKYV